MQTIKNIIRHWLPLAVISVAFCGLVYLVVQQELRISANDPQIQMAEDAAAAISGGARVPASLATAATVDLTTSLAPFLIMFDETGNIIASGGMLHGKNPSLPDGVLDYVKVNGEDRITWQPEQGVRMAAVIVRVGGPKGGYVLAGRSLREVEKRIDQLNLQVAAALVATLVASLVVVVLVELILGKRS